MYTKRECEEGKPEGKGKDYNAWVNARQVKADERRVKSENAKAQKERLWKKRDEVNSEIKEKIRQHKITEGTNKVPPGLRERLRKEFSDFYPEWKKFHQKLKKKKGGAWRVRYEYFIIQILICLF